MKTKLVHGELKCDCPPTCDDCDERFTCLDAGPLLPTQYVTDKDIRDSWPAGFSITMATKHVHKQTGWQFIATAASRPDNMVRLTCETEGLGTVTWQGTAQQFQKEFMKAEQHAAEKAERRHNEIVELF